MRSRRCGHYCSAPWLAVSTQSTDCQPQPVLLGWLLVSQLGFLLFLNFADLTVPMLLAHLPTFDPRWLQRWLPTGSAVLLFDGECALCNGCVRFAIAEEPRARLRFAPLDSTKQ